MQVMILVVLRASKTAGVASFFRLCCVSIAADMFYVTSLNLDYVILQSSFQGAEPDEVYYIL